MTVAEARELLAKLPSNAPPCYSLGDEQGTILEIGQIELVQVIGDAEGYVVTGRRRYFTRHQGRRRGVTLH